MFANLFAKKPSIIEDPNKNHNRRVSAAEVKPSDDSIVLKHKQTCP